MEFFYFRAHGGMSPPNDHFQVKKVNSIVDSHVSDILIKFAPLIKFDLQNDHLKVKLADNDLSGHFF